MRKMQHLCSTSSNAMDAIEPILLLFGFYCPVYANSAAITTPKTAKKRRFILGDVFAGLREP